MNCPNCQKEVDASDLRCPECGILLAKTKEDLYRQNTNTAAGVGWAMIAVGVLGFGFVIANSWTDWFSSLDFVGPALLVAVGAGILMTAKRK
jgi:hypothetical protein